jgi:anthranilate phosphoribosyltransferase
LFAALGVNLEATPATLQRALGEMVSFLLPRLSSDVQHIAPVRKALAARGSARSSTSSAL